MNIKKVLILFPEEGWSAPAYRTIYSAIRSEFEGNPKTNITLFGESLDLYLFSDESAQQNIAEFLGKKYSSMSIDLIIPVGSGSLNFVLRFRDRLFTEIPLVYCGEVALTNKRLEHSSHITGAALTLDIAGTIELARKIQPGLKRIAVIAGTGALDRFLLLLFHAAFKDYEGKLELIDLSGLALTDVLERVTRLPASTCILYLTFFRDSDGTIFSSAANQKLVSQAANVPLFNFIDTAMEYGSVGGRMTQIEAMARKAGQIALRVVNGESVASIEPTVINENPALFNWRELKRWGIDEKDLPPGSVIRFREPTLWSEHKEQIAGGTVLLLFEAGLILTLFLALRKTRRMKADLSASEMRYRTVADYSFVWVYWTAPDGTLKYISPACEEITGYTPGQFIENPSLIHEIVLPEDRNIFGGHERGCLSEENPIQYRITKADGEVRWIEHICRQVVDEKGNFNGIRVSNRDITNRKHSEDELSRAYLEIQKLKNRLEAESDFLKEEISLEHNFKNIVGKSDALKYVLYRIEQVAQTDSTVLILGETGTGKELMARAIHSSSNRSHHSLIKVNCAALQFSLIESELFGHEKGAFTGAVSRKIGRFEVAHKGTLFLDEIGELSIELQSKLLRVIEDGEFERLGSSKTIKADVRIIAATNRNLEKEMQAGRFREDLWYRLKVYTITVPPLRERLEDIPLFITHFLDGYNKELGRSVSKVPSKVIEILQGYHWPGNVRELKHVIMRAVLNSPGSTLQLIEPLTNLESPPLPVTDIAPPAHFLSLEEMERQYILKALAQAGWKISGKGGAAEILDINPETLRSRMRKLGIRNPNKH